MTSETVYHTLQPVFRADSEILILGSMPSPKSRETGFYYGHPQNRFWRVLAAVFGEDIPRSNEEKKDFVLRHHIALWDVLASCEIAGASDSSIRNPVPNPIGELLAKTKITRIYTTGAAAHQFYQKLVYPATGIKSVRLPSTSPANCACPMEKLQEAYSVLRGQSIG